MLTKYFFLIAKVNLSEEFRRLNFDCYGDTIFYKCQTWSNIENKITILWKITLPGMKPVMIARYDSNSSLHSINKAIDRTISSVLTHIEAKYAESRLMIKLLQGVILDGTRLECHSGALDNDSVILNTKLNGKYINGAYVSIQYILFT